MIDGKTPSWNLINKKCNLIQLALKSPHFCDAISRRKRKTEFLTSKSALTLEMCFFCFPRKFDGERIPILRINLTNTRSPIDISIHSFRRFTDDFSTLLEKANSSHLLLSFKPSKFLVFLTNLAAKRSKCGQKQTFSFETYRRLLGN